MNLARWRHLLTILLLGATLPLGVVISTRMATRSLERIKLREKTIAVKGFAERKFDSDLAEWYVSVTARDAKMVDAYATLEASRAKVLAFLAAQGFPPETVQLASANIAPQYAKDKEGRNTNEIEGYVLTQGVSVSTGDVARVARVAQQVSGLIKEGVELSASPPAYFFTGLDGLKLAMIAEATANARQRAEGLVAGSGSRVGGLESASQGVFQITPANSTEASGSGENDTSSLKKSIKAVVSVSYLIE